MAKKQMPKLDQKQAIVGSGKAMQYGTYVLIVLIGVTLIVGVVSYFIFSLIFTYLGIGWISFTIVGVILIGYYFLLDKKAKAAPRGA